MFDSDLVRPALDALLQANFESQPVALDASSTGSDNVVSIDTSNIQAMYGKISGLAEGKTRMMPEIHVAGVAASKY